MSLLSNYRPRTFKQGAEKYTCDQGTVRLGGAGRRAGEGQAPPLHGGREPSAEQCQGLLPLGQGLSKVIGHRGGGRRQPTAAPQTPASGPPRSPRRGGPSA